MPPHIYADLQEYLLNDDCKDWYGKLINDTLLCHDHAYTMMVAMHIDARRDFDEDDVVQSDAAERVEQRDAPLDFMCLDHPFHKIEHC